jgi:hypothetical protein
MHYITTKSMESLILSSIQRISWFVRENETEFIQLVREASTVQQEETVKDCKRRLNQSKRRHKELDELIKKLYEQNALGKLNDRHYERLLGEYDSEQTALETTMTELQAQIDTWSEDRLKTDRFIELVKRYTDFSELTTPMLNEFIEKVVVHEGDKRGTDRRQRVDIHLNFIGTFAVPADIITPMELEEQRRQDDEQAAKEQSSKEIEQARYARRLQENREFTARLKAGLLTPEELEEYNRRREHNRAWQKDWRKKQAAELPPKPPKPPKPLSLNAIAERVKAGLPLTPEETERHEAHKQRKNAQIKRWRDKQAPKPPKAKKPTKKEIITDIIARKNAGQILTPEEQEAYALHRENRNAQHTKWCNTQATNTPETLIIEELKKRLRDGLPLTPEQTAAYDAWISKKNEYRRELYQKTKAADLPTAVNQ